MSESRIIRVWIEFDLIEGQHFNPNEREMTDDEARMHAEADFLDTLIKINLDEYVQSRIIDRGSQS